MKTTSRIPTPVWGLLLLLVTLGGLGLGVFRLHRERDRLHRLEAQHQALRNLQDTAAARQAELASFAGGGIAELTALVNAYLPDLEVEITSATAALSFGYQLHSGTLRLREIPWEQLRRFLQLAESQSPPWRVTRLDLRAGLNGLEGEIDFQALGRGNVE